MQTNHSDLSPVRPSDPICPDGLPRRSGSETVIYTRFLRLLLLLAITVLVCGVPVQAAAKGSWVRLSGGYAYRLKTGRYLYGRKKIGTRYYYFNSSGIQLTGWRQISGRYYYFNPANGKYGYMMRNTTVSGIPLNKNGQAIASTSRARKKLPLLVRCTSIVDQYTTPFMSKGEKRWILYKHVRDDFANYVIGNYLDGNADWDISYANQLLVNGGGDCYAHAAGFAYLMHVLGINDVAVEHNRLHSWVRQGGYYFDPHWQKSIPACNCYHRTVAASGTHGVPDWAHIRTGYIRVDN